MTFNVGDKVTHTVCGEGEIVYGQHLVYGNDDTYLVKLASGDSRQLHGCNLTLRHAFAVGDRVTHRVYGNGGVVFGPYKGAATDQLRALVRFDNTPGRAHELWVHDLTLCTAEPKVGDRVRITGTTMYGDLPYGTVGVLMETDSYKECPYKVYSNDFSDYDFAASVELA